MEKINDGYLYYAEYQQLEAGLIQEGLELLENTEYKKHYMNQLWLNDYVLTTLDNHWFC